MCASTKGILHDFVEQCVLPRMRDLRGGVETTFKGYERVAKQDNLLDNAADMEKRMDTLRTKSGRRDRLGDRFSEPRVIAMLLIKGIRLATQVASLFVAQKVFSEQYVRKVYAEGLDPPHLRSMLLLFLAIDATVHMLVMLVVILISYVYKNDDNPTFVIDDGLIASALVEYLLSTTLIVVIGAAVAEVMYRKRYFDFPNQGTAVGKSYRDIMIGTAVVAFVIPFFMLL